MPWNNHCYTWQSSFFFAPALTSAGVILTWIMFLHSRLRNAKNIADTNDLHKSTNQVDKKHIAPQPSCKMNYCAPCDGGFAALDSLLSFGDEFYVYVAIWRLLWRLVYCYRSRSSKQNSYRRLFSQLQPLFCFRWQQWWEIVLFLNFPAYSYFYHYGYNILAIHSSNIWKENFKSPCWTICTT